MAANLLSSGAYRGRFAPSPSGQLHFGSLIAALASFLDAKANHGKWLVRIEDIDTPRVVAGADSAILRCLERFGMHWDEDVLYQSQSIARYEAALADLKQRDLVYACACTRKQIAALGGIYSGACKSKQLSFANNAIRFKQNAPCFEFNDLIKGRIKVEPNFAGEDFIIKRRDQLFAYQLVVVLDDIEQGITHIVRGADLLEPTVRQISLFNQLNKPAPQFAHVPLAVAEPGFKLSKQNHAPAVDENHPEHALLAALCFLGIDLASEFKNASIDDILAHAIAAWSLERVPKNNEIQIQKHGEQFNFIAL
jgi:glutamyl-Q tRNA(Asp) synthetase